MRLSLAARAIAWSMIFGAGVPQAFAETLSEAVKAAYTGDPSFLERQANQRALDETYVQARAGWRPTSGAQASISENRYDLGSGQGAELVTDATGNLIPVAGGTSFSYNSGTATLQASQPLYTGGRVGSAVDAAQADVLAGREDLRSAEVRLLQAVIQAYAGVLQNRDEVEVSSSERGALQKQVEQAQAKVDLGQATQVDLAQARARSAPGRTPNSPRPEADFVRARRPSPQSSGIRRPISPRSQRCPIFPSRSMTPWPTRKRKAPC